MALWWEAPLLMPFGKFRGWSVCALPSDYLTWLRALPDLRANLRDAVERECLSRFGHENNRQSDRRQSLINDSRDNQLLLELLHAGRRALALKYHPDRGGDAEQTARVNQLVDRLEQEIKWV